MGERGKGGAMEAGQLNEASRYLLGREGERLLLSAYPAGSEILATRSYRPGYRAYPMRVSLRTPEGGTEYCVIKTGDRIEPIKREASVLKVLNVSRREF